MPAAAFATIADYDATLIFTLRFALSAAACHFRQLPSRQRYAAFFRLFRYTPLIADEG